MKELYHEIKGNPGLLPKILDVIFRSGYFIHFKVKIPIIKQLLYLIYRIIDLLVVKLILNTDLLGTTQVGWGVKFYHPYGIIINDSSVIGNNAIIRAQVTIGNKGSANEACPHIGNNVDIGVGAKVIGDITIGNNVTIGANAVVTKSFPDNAVLVGVPAHNISR